MNRPRLVLHRGKEKSLQRRHPWLFSGAVNRIEGSPLVGDLVDIVDHSGTWMAVAHYQNDSIIAKVISFDTPSVDDKFWNDRLDEAIRYREQLGFFDPLRLTHTNAFRLVNGEGDFMPGLIVDYYAGVLVLQAHSLAMYQLFPLFVTLFQRLLHDRLPLVAIFNKSAATLPRVDGLSTIPIDGYLWGEQPTEWEISESDNRFLINFYEGQKTGFFLDQRSNRELVASLAHGRRVLNCFGYTGGFSLAALRGDAQYVETVDISKKAIALCERNVALNFPAAPHKGVAADVLKYLDAVPNNFDLIILDPPAFAKNHRSLKQGLKGYLSINQRAMEAICRGGWLLTFSCSQAVSNEDFQTMIFTAAALAHRQVRIVRRLPHAFDHPVSIYHPEGEYLKGLLLQVS